MQPTAFGPYSVVMSLGSGGMADVYLARDAKLDRLVAVKAPHRELVTAEIRARFRREAHAAAALEHPAIVPVYDYDESGELPYIVMRYLTGGSLEERIARQPYAPAEALSIVERVAAALDHAHHHGIVHRDVKSANILFDETGNAYVSDFGIAWMARAGDAGTRLTDTGVVRGTFDYISPEQARGERELDGRSDLYSLAVVLFEMLTGDVPYRAESGVFVAAQHISAPIPDIRQWRPDLPPAVAAVIRRALAKQRDERYPTGAALVADLRQALAGGRVATPRPTGAGQPAAGRRNLWLALGAVATLGVVAFALLRGGGSGRPTATPTNERPTTVATEPTAAARPTAIERQAVETAAPEPTSTTLPSRSLPPATPQLGDSRSLTLPGGVNVRQQFVPAGTFLMGSQDDPDAMGNEYPRHEVALDAFWIDQTEVTNDQFAAYVAATGHQTAAERDGQGRVRVETGWINSLGVYWQRPVNPDGPPPNGELPVVQVSWDDAQAYCAWAGGRLPTEAEWEYAARGSSSIRYPWGDSFDGQVTNFCDASCEFSWADNSADDGFAGLAPAGSFPEGASWVGANDMVGNVWEWVNDWYRNGYYEESPASNPPGPDSGEFRILRGGAWYNEAKTMRAAMRGSDRPEDHDNGAGFRCVADYEPPVNVAELADGTRAGDVVPPAVPDEIVFQSNRDGDYEIYIMPAAGGEARQLTDNGAADNYPRVSPDGRHIVFVSERDGNPEIYVMNRDGSEQTRLTADTAREDLPAWSPDGREIVFVSSRDGLMDVFIMDADGSNVRQITDSLEREGHISWSVNDQLAYNGSRELYWQLWLSDADGANRRQLTNSTYDEWSPEWSPDGEWLLFLSERDSRTNPGIYVMRPDGSDARLVYNGSGEEWGAVWSADGTQIVFTVVQPDDSDNLYIMNADGSDVRLLAERGSYASWAASSGGAGDRRAMPGSSGMGVEASFSPFAAAPLPLTGDGLVQLTFGERNHYTPMFAPDQSRLLLSVEMDDGWQVYEADPNGGGLLRQITHGAFDHYQAAWSPDGRTLLTSANLDGDGDIYLMDTATGEVLQHLVDTPGLDYHPRWLPDGQSFIFSSDADGDHDVYRGTLAGEQTKLTHNDTFDGFATPSADGQYITFYAGRDGDYEIYVMDAEGGDARRLTVSRGRDASPSFSPDGQWIVFESERSGNYELYAVPFAGGEATRLTDSPGGNWFPVVSPDGEWLLFQSDRGGYMDVYRQEWTLGE